jgi:hypothetical protein
MRTPVADVAYFLLTGLAQRELECRSKGSPSLPGPIRDPQPAEGSNGVRKSRQDFFRKDVTLGTNRLRLIK